MSALPVDPTPREDPLDPESILRALPDRERETFLAEYRRAVDGARDPARWPELRRFLRLWAWRAVAVAEPGYYESWEQANAGTGGGMLLEGPLVVSSEKTTIQSGCGYQLLVAACGSAR